MDGTIDLRNYLSGPPQLYQLYKLCWFYNFEFENYVMLKKEFGKRNVPLNEVLEGKSFWEISKSLFRTTVSNFYFLSFKMWVQSKFWTVKNFDS